MNASVIREKVCKGIKKNIAGWLFAMPVILGIAIFTLYPCLNSFVTSFYEYDAATTAEFIGFANYIKIFTNDDEFWQVLGNTFLFTAINIPLTLVLSYLLAWFLNRSIKGIYAFRVAYYLPVMIPAVVSGLLWKDILDPTLGFANKVLGVFGLHSEFLNAASSSMPSIFLMNVWTIGGGMVLWIAQFKNIPNAMYEAAEIDGASSARKFFTITIPLSTPMIFYNVITGVIGTLQYNGTLTYAPRGGRGIENSIYMYAVKIYRDAFVRFDLGYASALAWILLIIIAALTIVLFMNKGWVNYGED